MEQKAKFTARIELAESNRLDAETNSVTSLTGCQARIEKERAQIDHIQTRIGQQGETFDTIAEGIDALFNRMECDRTIVTRSLGKSTSVDGDNILDFLLAIENQSNFLIRVYMASRDEHQGGEKPSSPNKSSSRKSTTSRASVASSEYGHEADFKDANGMF